MTPPRHRISPATFAALAAGHGGAEAARQLVAIQYSRSVLLAYGVADRAARTDHPRARQIRQAFDLLADIQSDAPEAVDDILRYPSVGAWALQVLTGDADPSGLACVAAAAAVLSGSECTIDVPVSRGRLTLPSLGQAVLHHGSTARVHATGRGGVITAAGSPAVEIPPDPHEDAPGWMGLRYLVADPSPSSGFRLLLDDLDPYRLPGAPLRGRLSEQEVDVWEAALRDAWRLLRLHHRTTAAEVRTTIRVLTPLRYSARDHLSATSSHAFGSTALSEPGDGLTVAGTLAHEVQHAKLSALLNAVALTRPGDTRRFYAPWRDDPRPLDGLLQGAYAYLGVSGFWRRQRHFETGENEILAHAEFARWREAAHEVCRILIDSGGLTPAGETFVSGMYDTLRRWRNEDVPAVSAEIALRSARHHRRSWHQRNARR
jgi:uncharacterized protein